MTPEEIIIRDQEEIRRLKAKVGELCQQNIRLKMHMQVLVNSPNCKTAERIRFTAGNGEIFNDSTINLN